MQNPHALVSTAGTCLLCTFLMGAADRGCIQSPESYQRIANLGTSATNPQTGECQLFATTQDMPKTWEACDSPDLQRYCLQVITPARASRWDACISFPTPCDVPKGWSSCPQSEVVADSNAPPPAP